MSRKTKYIVLVIDQDYQNTRHKRDPTPWYGPTEVILEFDT